MIEEAAKHPKVINPEGELETSTRIIKAVAV